MILLLICLYALVEALLRRPLLATLVGRVVARVLHGTVVHPLLGGPGVIYNVPRIRTPIGRVQGLTLGTIILTTNLTWNMELHEGTHVQQWRRWGSIGFALAYCICWGVQAVRFGVAQAYRHNPFEVAAYAAEGAQHAVGN